MVQTWVDNNEGAGGDIVLDGMINLENKLDSVRSAFSGTAFPTDSARVVGQCCWRTDSGETEGPGLYRLKTKDPTPSNDVWIFQFGDTALTLFGESLNNSANAAAARTLLGLGTASTLVSGTGAGEVQTNSQNEGDYLQIANDLSDVTAATARTNLGLQALAILATVGTTELDALAVTRAKLAVIEQSFQMLTKSGAFTAAAMDHITATVGTSWTLTLPAAPNAGDRVSIYCKSVTAGQVLTIDGGTKTIIGGITTTLSMYVAGDQAELCYDGTEWVPSSSLYLAPHYGQISVAGFTRAAGSTLLIVPFDTDDFSGANAGLGDHTSDRITIKRAGNYQIDGQLLFDQFGPTRMVLQTKLNGTTPIQEALVDNLHDWDSGTHRSQVALSHIYALAAGDYVELFQAEEVAAAPASYARLSVKELR